MTVAKFKVVIRREKLSKSTNEAPVCLRITKDRKVTYKTLLHVSPDYWDDKEQCVKKQHPNTVALNAIISQRKAELEKETCFLALKDNSVSIETKSMIGPHLICLSMPISILNTYIRIKSTLLTRNTSLSLRNCAFMLVRKPYR